MLDANLSVISLMMSSVILLPLLIMLLCTLNLIGHLIFAKASISLWNAFQSTVEWGRFAVDVKVNDGWVFPSRKNHLWRLLELPFTFNRTRDLKWFLLLVLFPKKFPKSKFFSLELLLYLHKCLLKKSLVMTLYSWHW